MHADRARADTRHAPLTSQPRAVCLSSIGRGPGYAVYLSNFMKSGFRSQLKFQTVTPHPPKPSETVR
eukprot:2682529-Prymnesium_polylepis.1